MELWHNPRNKESKSEKQPPALSGYLTCTKQPQHLYYSKIVDHYLFLYDTPQPNQNGHFFDCFDGVFRRRQTAPQNEQQHVGDLLQVVDLLSTKLINKREITLEDSTRFEAYRDSSYIDTVFHHIQDYTENKAIKVYTYNTISIMTLIRCLIIASGHDFCSIKGTSIRETALHIDRIWRFLQSRATPSNLYLRFLCFTCEHSKFVHIKWRRAVSPYSGITYHATSVDDI